MLKWKRVGKHVDKEGTAIIYEAQDTKYPLSIESRKKHIPHANGIGTWDHTSYFVQFFERDVAEEYSLRDAKEYAEKYYEERLKEI